VALRNANGRTEQEIAQRADERDAAEKAARGVVRVLLDRDGRPVGWK
jgi:hypothetical protein